MDQIKRILILTNDTGFGHRSAANAVAAAIQKNHPDECIVEIANPLDDEHAPAILRDSQADYDKIVRDMPEKYKLRYEFSDAAVPSAIIESALTVMLFNIIRDLIGSFQPDVIVSTHSMYAAPFSAVITVHKLDIPYIVIVTDLTNVHRMWFHNSAAMILVPNLAVCDQAKEHGIMEERVQVTGIPVNPELLEEIREPVEIRREFGWRPNDKTVLVVGSKRIKGLEDVLHILNHSALPMQLAIIAGGDDELYGRLLKTDWHLPVHLYNFVSNMPSLMRASDVIMSKAGGLIVTESLAAGRPLLLVDVTPGQEEGNADYVVNNGAGLLASSPADALEHLFHWTHDQAGLLKYQERALSLGRPQAAFTISELVWIAAEKGRISTPQDGTARRFKILELLASFGIGSQPGIDDRT